MSMFRVSSSELRQKAEQLEQMNTQFKSAVESLGNQEQSLAAMWEGEAQKAYASRFKALDGDMAQIQLKINEHVTDLNEMAETYKRAETFNTTNINGLSSDYIND